MNKYKALRVFAQIKRRRYSILFLIPLFLFFNLYQNCGSSRVSSTTSSTTGGANTANTGANTATGSAVLTADKTTYAFPLASGNTAATFTISNPSAYLARYLMVTTGSSNNAFTIVTDTCSGISLSGGSTCSIQINYSTTAVFSNSEVISVNYANANLAAQTPLQIMLSGPAVGGATNTNSAATANVPIATATVSSWLVTTSQTFSVNDIVSYASVSKDGPLDAWCYTKSGTGGDPTCIDRDSVAGNFCRVMGYQEATSFKTQQFNKTYYFKDPSRMDGNRICDGKGQPGCIGLSEVVCEKSQKVTSDPGSSYVTSNPVTTVTTQVADQVVRTKEQMTNNRIQTLRNGTTMPYSTCSTANDCDASLAADRICQSFGYLDHSKFVKTNVAKAGYQGSDGFCNSSTGNCPAFASITCYKEASSATNVFYLIDPTNTGNDIKFPYGSRGDYPLDAFRKNGDGSVNGAATDYCKSRGYAKASSMLTGNVTFTLYQYDSLTGFPPVQQSCGSIWGTNLACGAILKVVCVK